MLSTYFAANALWWNFLENFLANKKYLTIIFSCIREESSGLTDPACKVKSWFFLQIVNEISLRGHTMSSKVKANLSSLKKNKDHFL
jgi:hypothetical protein